MATCKNTPLAWRVVLAGLLLLHASGERIEDNGLYTDCVADKPNCKSLYAAHFLASRVPM
jgi:hypothetical protein